MTNTNDSVSIVYSPGYGAGWYTWNKIHLNAAALLTDSIIVQSVENNDLQAAKARALELCPDAIVMADTLSIASVPRGSRVLVREYDGYETVEILEQIEPDLVV